MKILVDATAIFRNRTGVGQYTYRTLEHLFKLDSKNQYYLFGFLFLGKKFKAPYKPYQKLPDNFHYRLLRYVPSKAFNFVSRRLWMPPIDLLTFLQPDITIFFNFVKAPVPLSKKTVAVIYDIVFELYPQYVEKKNLQYMKKYVPHSAKHADRVVTISEASKQGIIEHYGIDEEKISIIPPSVDHSQYFPHKKAAIEKVKKRYKITRDYMLFIGTLEPRKNVNGVIEAYKKLPEKLQKKYALVLVGDQGWLDKDIKAALKSNKNLKIITTGYVPDKDLPVLYSGAEVFVFPAFYEGFGMPPLEAMAAGTAVITSNTSSLPEVVEDAGIMINPNDNDELAQQIQRVLTKPELRKELEKKGKARAKQFSWDKSAKDWKKLIDELEEEIREDRN